MLMDEIRNLSVKDLFRKIDSLNREMISSSLRVKNDNRDLNKKKSIRKDIARLMTVVNERRKK